MSDGYDRLVGRGVERSVGVGGNCVATACLSVQQMIQALYKVYWLWWEGSEECVTHCVCGAKGHTVGVLKPMTGALRWRHRCITGEVSMHLRHPSPSTVTLSHSSFMLPPH